MICPPPHLRTFPVALLRRLFVPFLPRVSMRSCHRFLSLIPARCSLLFFLRFTMDARQYGRTTFPSLFNENLRLRPPCVQLGPLSPTGGWHFDSGATFESVRSLHRPHSSCTTAVLVRSYSSRCPFLNVEAPRLTRRPPGSLCRAHGDLAFSFSRKVSPFKSSKAKKESPPPIPGPPFPLFIPLT